ncbi:alpha/beta hydrolase [Mesorhizobium sp. LMG 17147]|uniref:alpha/beta hydrolase n=1 Tax=Mesorhizobium sp. LMG 17147 TaxID=2963091 RepID=UPI0020C97F63|nr:alpha/beta hydrolase [Mesorhizobium sp. LMG 17147]MCP9230297.1 alpha/beta hydrolase [Mesorhizobium sp. LMG 17147]
MASFGLKVIRGTFGVTEHVAPRLTGRAAFELFCRTPHEKSLSEGERRAIDRAADFMTQARHHRLKTRTGCVMVHEFRPEPGRDTAGTVLVIHGWRSRTEYMRTLIEAYRDAGYKVVSLDLPGHGQSQGRRLTLVSAVDAARVAGEWFGPFAAIVGHSFGGAVAANAVAGSIRNIPRLAAGRLVLIAAPSSLPAIFADFSRMLNVGSRSQVAMADRVERIAGRPLQEFTGDRQLASTLLPTLVIHAPDDREVSADHARLYARAGDHVRLYWADGLGHRRILADKGVVERAVGFVDGRLEPFLQ